MSALWFGAATLFVLVSVAVVRSYRADADMRRRIRVEEWARQYQAALRVTGCHTPEGLWVANLSDMTLRYEGTDRDGEFEIQRFDQRHPDGAQAGVIGRWYRRQTAASWAAECWQLHDDLQSAQFMRSACRRRLREHLRSRPAWVLLSDETANALEHQKGVLRQLIAGRPRPEEASHLWEVEALLRGIERDEYLKLATKRST